MNRFKTIVAVLLALIVLAAGLYVLVKFILPLLRSLLGILVMDLFYLLPS